MMPRFARLLAILAVGSSFACSSSDGSTAGATGAGAGVGEVDVGGEGGGTNAGGGSDESSGSGDAPDGPPQVGAGTGGGGTCSDPCPAPNGGVTIGCEKRFMYGVNYAWDHYAGDFGGIPEWGQPGVAADAATHTSRLADMHDHGVNVVRWWMFPELRGDGVTVDQSETITGLGATTVADVEKALEIADTTDVNIMFALFSFDGFRPSGAASGIYTPSLAAMVTDPAKRQALLEELVRPIAKAVEASPHGRRMVAWDVINEPEWALSGTDPYGDPPFSTNPELVAVSHAQMESFIADVVEVLREESGALITVGAAAFEWSKAWSKIDQDFYQFHFYDWINQYWPYTGSPADYGLEDKPLVMGEFPLGSLSGVSYGDLINTWWSLGYAGAMGWQYDEAAGGELTAVKAFADQHVCETHY